MDSQQEDPVSGDISSQGLLVAFLAIVAEAVAARLLELAVADQLLIAGCRAFIQLSCLGVVLHPIFSASNPGIVLGYIFGFMIMVSAYEAAARPKVTYPGIFRNAVVSLGGSLLGAGAVLLFIVTPSPWYDAQYLIPLAGMLINNSLSGVALALNEMIDHLTTQREYVSVLLAFGATPWEAAWPGFVRSAQKALIPAINGMNVIGLVSIPGMMTGQILGGASPMKAARYQIVITFLISGCTFMAVGFICLLTIDACFDERGRHDTSCMVKQSRLKIAQWSLLPSLRRRILDPLRRLLGAPPPPPPAAARPAASERLLDGDRSEGGRAGGPLKLVAQLPSNEGAPHEAAEDGEEVPVLLDVDLEGLVAAARPLAARLRLRSGEVGVVMGPSGIGKSTLLKWICDLQPADRSEMSLSTAASESMSAEQWRRDVLYVHQSKAPLPENPRELLRAVSRLRVNRGRPEPDAGRFIRALGLVEALLDRPWNELSGGEAQRMMLAIALSTQPACLLLDEPTSALDDASKMLVEAALRAPGLSALVVTHDEQQAARFKGSVWRVAER